MNRSTSPEECALRRIDPFDLHWILITAGLVLLCFMTACTKSDATANVASPPPEVSVVMSQGAAAIQTANQPRG